MSAILVEKIGVNAYAPEGANEIDLYSFGGAEGLTLPQLMMAICIRRAALIEDQSVLKMNEINASAAWLEILTAVGEQILSRRSLDGTLNLKRTSYVPRNVPEVTTYWDFLTKEVGLDEDAVPHELATVDDRTKMFAKLKDRINAASTNNQEQMIELQSFLSRRDTTYNTSAAIVKKLGSAMNASAANF